MKMIGFFFLFCLMIGSFINGIWFLVNFVYIFMFDMCFVKMLFFVGFGLGDVKDIIVKGLEVVKKCKRVYLEVYMLILIVGKDVLVWILIYDVIILYMICIN